MIDGIPTFVSKKMMISRKKLYPESWAPANVGAMNGKDLNAVETIARCQIASCPCAPQKNNPQGPLVQ